MRGGGRKNPVSGAIMNAQDVVIRSDGHRMWSSDGHRKRFPASTTSRQGNRLDELLRKTAYSAAVT